MRSRRIFGLLGLIFMLNLSGAVGFLPGRRRQPDDVADGNNADAATPSAATEAVSVRARHMTLAGHILPILKRFVITGEKATAIARALSDAVCLTEFFMIGAIGWLWVPLNKAIFTALQVFKSEPEQVGGEEDAQSAGELQQPQEMEFESTAYWYQMARHISQAAKLGALVYAADCLAVILNTIGFRYKQQAGFSKKAASISFSVWIALRIGELKRYIINKACQKRKDGPGQARALNGAVDIILATVTLSHILDMFEIDFGLAITSLLSIGGVGTLVFSLASKDLATELVSGLVVSASDRFMTGDQIMMGDGTAGVITHMGLLHTDLRAPDEVVTRIPNSQLASQRTRNMSRAAPRSQVTQTLRFSYSDISKIPELLDAIKDEIRASCPELIVDGSRPFRVHWRNFNDDHLEVVVDAHFNVKPTGDAYWDNRQKVLLAIARAAKKLQVEFTLPVSICKQDA